MSVLGLSGPSPLPPPVVSDRDKSDRKVIATIIACVVVVVVGSIGGVMCYWIHFSKKYGHIDRSRETLSYDTDGSQDVDHATAVSTTYANPAYGVSLTLPGKWRRAAVPNQNQSFIGLVADRDDSMAHFAAQFRPFFTGVPESVDMEANTLAGRYANLADTKLDNREQITIGDRTATILRFSTGARKSSFVIVVVNKGPVAYVLIIVGPADTAANWQRLDSMLPQSIRID
jgi:hypothetical protein